MTELNDFYNEGFGWICRQCERELHPVTPSGHKHSRAFREGEAENKSPELSTHALARWTDKTRQFLTCPRCHLTEAVDKS